MFLLFYYASVSVLTHLLGRRLQPLARRTPTASTSGTPPSSPAGLVLAGVLSDLARVRKPFMLIGAIVRHGDDGFLITQTDHPHTGYYANVLVIVLLAVSISLRLRTVDGELHRAGRVAQPGAHRVGLAIWGWILRITVALSFLVLPYVITTSTVLVDNQTAAHDPAGHPGRPALLALDDRAVPATPAPESVIADLRATGEAGPRHARHRPRRPATAPTTCSRRCVPPAA